MTLLCALAGHSLVPQTLNGRDLPTYFPEGVWVDESVFVQGACRCVLGPFAFTYASTL